MTFLRSYADDLPLQDWLNQQVFPREGQLTEDDVYWLNILGIMEYLTSGITSNFDMYFFPPVDAKASADTGFRTVQTSGLNNFGGTVELMEENYHIVNEMSDLTSFIVGFHAEYTTSKELMEGVAALAQKLKSPVWLHNSETKLEVAECKERWGMTPTQLTDSLGMYEYGGGGYHCVWFEEPDFEIFKKRHLTAVTNPASNLKLASGICPVSYTHLHGNKFGVRIRATSPSIHMIRANIETEIAPIVGSEEQANDLIAYIREGEKSEEGAWETNIFGKSIGELMENGIRGKISMMDDECQMKLQDTMQKIVNDNNGGMVCIIL